MPNKFEQQICMYLTKNNTDIHKQTLFAYEIYAN